MAEKTYPKNTVAWIREKDHGEWILAIVKDHTWVFLLATNDRITGSVSPLSAVVDVRVIERPDAHPPVTAEPVVERVQVGEDTYIPAVNVVAWMKAAADALAEARGVNAVHWADVADGIERMAAKIRDAAEPATAPSVEQGRGWTDAEGKPVYAPFTGASVDNSDATVRFDLVEGLNVEEWADRAERLRVSYLALEDVVENARGALEAHGFTSDTLESQTLAESIHALAGRGAPSVEQIAEVLMDWVIDPSAAAEAIHALYGTPGNAGEGSAVCAGDYNAMHRRAVAAEEREESQHLRAEKVGELLSIAERQRDEANKRAEKAEAEVQRVMVASHRYASDREDLQQEVVALEEQGERHKAALEAAWEYAAAILGKLSATRENSEAQANARRTEAHVYSASQNVEEKFATALAARAAVEAETSEESGA